MRISSSKAVYVISVAAELASMHPQTLRQYDRMGLVTPQRTAGRGRRYSADDIAKLQLIQQLSQEEGINLAGIKKILDLQTEVRRLEERAEELAQKLSDARAEAGASSDAARARAARRAAWEAQFGRTGGSGYAQDGRDGSRVFAAGSSGDVFSVLRGRRPMRPRAAALPAGRSRGGEIIVYSDED